MTTPTANYPIFPPDALSNYKKKIDELRSYNNEHKTDLSKKQETFYIGMLTAGLTLTPTILMINSALHNYTYSPNLESLSFYGAAYNTITSVANISISGLAGLFIGFGVTYAACMPTLFSNYIVDSYSTGNQALEIAQNIILESKQTLNKKSDSTQRCSDLKELEIVEKDLQKKMKANHFFGFYSDEIRKTFAEIAPAITTLSLLGTMLTSSINIFSARTSPISYSTLSIVLPMGVLVGLQCISQYLFHNNLVKAHLDFTSDLIENLKNQQELRKLEKDTL